MMIFLFFEVIRGLLKFDELIMFESDCSENRLYEIHIKENNYTDS